MTSMTSLDPVPRIAAATAVAARTGSTPTSQWLPSLAMQGTAAANNFAGLLAASELQASPTPSPSPAPAQAPPPPPVQTPFVQNATLGLADAQAGRRVVDQPGPRSAGPVSQAAEPPDADSAADDTTATAAATTAGDDDPVDATDTPDGKATAAHRTRKAGPAASSDAHVAGAASPALQPAEAAAASRGADAGAAVDDRSVSAADGHPADRRKAQSVSGIDGPVGAASTTASMQGAASTRDDKANVAIGVHADLRAAAETTAADAVAAAAAQASSGATVEAMAAAPTGDVGNVGAAGAASAASALDLRSAAPSATTATASVVVATPTDAPEFREALGAQVSLLVKDGVQTAELHLNPADMGPISVRIAMDGAQAKIDFGADSADTRRLIETGLPELASALRDAGFTLSGGGVSDHRQGRSGGDADARGAGGSRRIDGSADADAVSARHTVSAASLQRAGRGGLDLYA